MNPTDFYKCLADDTRLRCLLLIESQRELCVCELTEALDLSQPKISRHLAQLRKCGLLSDRRQGQWVFYQINPALDAWAKEVITHTLKAQSHFIKSNIQALESMGDRPQRTQACCA